VMVTVDDEGNCLDGASPANAAALLTEWGADAIGVNCSTGPTTVLTAIEAMRKATTLPLAAMPNAGCPEPLRAAISTSARQSIWQALPARPLPPGADCGRLLRHYSNHIRAMRSAMRAIDAQARVESSAPHPL